VRPLTPYLLFCLLTGVRTLTEHWIRIARVALLCLIGLDVLDHNAVPLPGPSFEYTVRYRSARRKLWVIENRSAPD
jgi:hypothetical protein